MIVGQKRKVPELLSIYLDEVLRKGSKMVGYSYRTFVVQQLV